MLFMGTIPVSALATEAQETDSDTTASIVEIDAAADSIQEPENEEIQTEETEDAIQTDEMSENEMDQDDVVAEDTTDDLFPEQIETFAASAVEKNKYDSYEQFLAYYYLTYSSLDYYLNNDELPYQTYVKNADESFKKSLENWRLATLDAGNLVKYSTKEVEFYEMIVFDILYQNVSEDTVLKNAETAVNALQSSLVKDLAETGYEWTMDTKVTEENADEILNRLISLDNLKFLSKEVSTLKKGIKYTKTMEALIEKLSMLIKLKYCSTEVNSILTDLYNKSTDEQMKEGCRQLALVASGLMNEEEIIGIFSGQVALKSVSEYALEKIWKGVISSTSLGKGFEIGQKVGKLASNALCSTDKIVENWYSMEQICKFEKVLKEQLLVYKNNFVNNPTCESARIFNQAVNMYLNTQSVGMTYAIKYVEAVKGGGLFGYIYKNFTNKDDYNQLISQLNSIKRNIDLTVEFANNNTHDFYLDDMQANGVEIPWESSNSEVTQKEVEDSGKDVSNSLFKLTNQYVSEDTSYSEDKLTYGSYYLKNGATLDLQGKTLTVYGDFYCEGTLQIRGGTLNVLGNLYVPSGYVDVNGGKIAVGENAYFVKIGTDGRYSGHGGTLTMDNEKDEFIIGGDFITYLNISGYYFNAKNGTIRIGGGWTNYHEIYNSGNLRVVFTGDKDITINGIEKIYAAYMQIENASQRTVSMKGYVGAGNLEGENFRIKAENVPELNFATTNSTLNISGDTWLSVGTKAGGDINIDGNCTLTDLNLNGKSMDIQGYLYHTYGNMDINGGKVSVKGNAYFAGKGTDGRYSSHGGTLTMDNEKDEFIIGGDFITYLNYSGYYFDAKKGTIRIGGGWTNYSGLYTTGNLRVVFTGDKDITVNGIEAIYVAYMQIENASQRTVTMKGSISTDQLEGKNINLVAEKKPYLYFKTTTGSLKIIGDCRLAVPTKSGGDISVNGDLYSNGIAVGANTLSVDGTLYLNSNNTLLLGASGKLNVSSDVWMKSGTLSLAGTTQISGNLYQESGTVNVNGGLLKIEQDYRIQASDDSTGELMWSTGNGKLVMTKTKDRVVVGENFYMQSSLDHEYYLSAGTLAVMGDFYQISDDKASAYNFQASGTHTVMLAGTMPQKVVFQSDKSKFNRLQLTQDIDQYAFQPEKCWNVKEEGISVPGEYKFYIAKGNGWKIDLNGVLNVYRDLETVDCQWSKYADSVKKIVLEDGCTTIFDEEFADMDQVTSVSIPETVTSIGNKAFYRCEKLEYVEIFAAVVRVGNYAFAKSGLSDLTIQSSNLTLGAGAFADCVKLNKITFNGNAPVIEDGNAEAVFQGVTAEANYDTENETWTKTIRKKLGGKIKWNTNVVAEKVAEGYCGNNLTWVLTNDGTITFSGTGDMRNYSSASSTSWYAYRDQITSIELEDGITSIGNFAFYGLENVVDVTIPEGVTSIGGFAFKNCTSLETVDLPSTLKKLGESAFFGCSKLSKIVIPEGIYTIWGYTFKNCTSLKEVTLPSTLIKVDEAAFYGCSSVKELDIPSNVSIIGIYCFKNCTSLAKVTLPEKLTEIREAVFYATALSEIEIPEGVKKIGPYAFKNCTALKTVTLPKTLTSVGEASFYSCTALTEITLPDNVTSIGNYAFRKCENLDTLNLSANLETIGESAFYGCTGLKTLTIPENVSVIGAYAFKSCTGVTEVSLPDSLKELGDSAFYGCTAVKEIVIPENVSKVGAYAFSRCSSLSQVTFRGNAPEIGDSAFSKVTATISYPADKTGWTQDKRNNYGGTLTWEEK